MADTEAALEELRHVRGAYTLLVTSSLAVLCLLLVTRSDTPEALRELDVLARDADLAASDPTRFAFENSVSVRASYEDLMADVGPALRSSEKHVAFPAALSNAVRVIPSPASTKPGGVTLGLTIERVRQAMETSSCLVQRVARLDLSGQPLQWIHEKTYSRTAYNTITTGWGPDLDTLQVVSWPKDSREKGQAQIDLLRRLKFRRGEEN